MAPQPVDVFLERGSKLITRLKSYYIKDVDTAPLISERSALLCALLYTACYVAPFYLSHTLRASPLQSRDAPTVIRARVRAVGLTCLVCTLVTSYMLTIYGHASPQDVARLLGVWPVNGVDILKVFGLVAILFVGPLYEGIIVDGDWREWSPANFKDAIFDSWIGYRNLIIAPVSEELVFRSLTISVYLLAKVEPSRIIFFTPLIFGLAHVHHLVDFLQAYTPQGQRSPPLKIWITGIIRSLFQFTYTSLFGFFAAFVFLRTGSLWAVIVAHTFCNWQGVPRLYGRVGQFNYYPSHVTPDVAQGKRNDNGDGAKVNVGNSLMQEEAEDEQNGPNAIHNQHQGAYSASIGWTVVYYVLIVAGAFGFYEMLWSLTESSNALAAF